MTDEQRWSVIFARRVRQLREGRGWSQAELGRQLGNHGHKLGQARIAAIEAAGSVNLDQVQAFTRALGVPVEVLLGEPAPAAGDVYVRQLQRLARISNAVWDHREQINRIVAEIQAEIPGRLPPGTAVTADAVIDLPPLPESE